MKPNISYKLGKFKLEELREDDLELVRKWRNSEHVKKWMFTEDHITRKHQKEWFASRTNRSDLIFYCGKEKIGLVYFYNQDLLHRRCEFGFYIGEKNYQLSGMGSVMEFMALDMVFNKWEFNKVLNTLLPENKRVINMHKKFGFKQEGFLRKHNIKKRKYVDVVVQGILREEWLAVRDGIYDTLHVFYKF